MVAAISAPSPLQRTNTVRRRCGVVLVLIYPGLNHGVPQKDSLFSIGYSPRIVGHTLEDQVSNPPVTRRCAVCDHYRRAGSDPACGNGGITVP